MENTESKLERIFPIDGKFVDSNKKEVNPKQIGLSFVVLLNNYLHISERVVSAIKEEIKSQKNYLEANAYTAGIDKRASDESWNKLTYVPITLFKI